MSIGAKVPIWRRFLYRSFDSVYIHRKYITEDGFFCAYVSGGSSLKTLKPSRLKVDPVHQRFINDWIEPRSVVWDVGTNLGLFALPAALKATSGVVYGFEPDVEIARHVMRSLRLSANKSLNVRLFCLAISDVDGTANFQVSKYSRAMNRLEGMGPWHDGHVQTAEMRSVATLRIDTLAKSLVGPTILKIDVEGAEMHVLDGARETIEKCRPTILIEGPKELWGPMGDFFRANRYVMLDGGVDGRVEVSHPVWDTVAVPAERYRP